MCVGVLKKVLCFRSVYSHHLILPIYVFCPLFYGFGLQQNDVESSGFGRQKKCVLYVFYKTQQWNYRKPKSMKISEWQRRSRLRIKKTLTITEKIGRKGWENTRPRRQRIRKKSIVFIKDLDPSVWYKSIVTLNRFTIEAILHKSHEWKCVTHKIISMVVIIYVNQC